MSAFGLVLLTRRATVPALGTKLAEKFHPFWHQRADEHIDPGEIAAGAVEAGDET
jgi:hypothetical protein